MTARAVRDTCIELARKADSRLERVALLAIAFLAERDESAECVISTSDMSDAERDRFIDRALDRFMEKTLGTKVG